ncbi:MAG: hypothetical protein HRU29_01700 [Rhizobiales bacterium]|nr:hypothetical protein [Hyphomicrobiales bacterium]NRB13089.1 hypothetical protein [Hyphomicrobiales bacterium]
MPKPYTCELRKETLIALKKGRWQLGGKRRPTNWVPQTVKRSDGFEDYHTHYSARQLLEDELSKGVEVFEMSLDHPPNGTGYYFEIPIKDSVEKLYVKFEIVSGCVIGRSFHISEKKDKI